MSFLSNLRSRPDGVKSRIAVLGAILFTGLVGVVWTSTLPVRFATLQNGLEKGVENTATAKNALTDLVAEIEQTPPLPEDSESFDTAQESFMMEESALDRLAGERFDPTEEAETNSEGGETGTATAPEPAPVTTIAPEQEETSEPRVILIGTTTAPDTYRLPVTW